MKKKSGLSNLKRVLICVVLFMASAFCITSGISKILTTIEINNSIEDDKQKSKELTEQLDELNEEKTNLTNPEYLEYLARGKYLVTKSGEQVFKFPSLNDDSTQETE